VSESFSAHKETPERAISGFLKTFDGYISHMHTPRDEYIGD